MKSAAVTFTLLALALSPAVAAPPFDYVLTVTSDYDVSGQVSTVDVMPHWTVDDHVSPVHSDADARYHDGLIYVINHLYGDNIQVLDPEQGFATVRQFSVGPGTQPRRHRPRLSREGLRLAQREHVAPGGRHDDGRRDGLDRPLRVRRRGRRAGDGGARAQRWLPYVAVQRLDRDYFWSPVPPSYLVVIDTATNEIVDPDPQMPGLPAITLTGTNPYRTLHVDGDALYVAESGAWGSLDGGIERIDTGQMVAQGFVTTESQLGGDIYDFTLPVGGRAHAVISSFSGGYEQFCVSFNWSTGAKIADVWRPGGYDVMDVETHPGTAQLFLADRTYSNPGVRVFDATDDSQLTTSPLNVGLPPHDLLIVGDAVTGVGESVVSRVTYLAAAPNPMRAGGEVELVLSSGSARGTRSRKAPPPRSSMSPAGSSGASSRLMAVSSPGTAGTGPVPASQEGSTSPERSSTTERRRPRRSWYLR